MGDSGGMSASAGISAASSLAGAYSQSEALKSQSDYQRSMSAINARFADIQGKDAIERGEKEAQKLKKGAKRTIGAQRAALAAQGIDVNEGSALELQEDTDKLSSEDAMQIRNNAWREAWGYRVQAQNISSQSAMSSIGANAQARSTLLTGGLNALAYGAKAYGAPKGDKKTT